MLRDKNYKRRRGFTLTEMVIVLTAVSILIGAIWVVGDKTWSNFGAYRTNKQVMQIAQNIREQYMNVQTPPAWLNPGGDITLILDSLNLFPLEMRRTATANQFIDHSLYDGQDTTSLNNGSVHVFYVNAAGVASMPSAPACGRAACFRLWLYGLDTSACAKLLRSLPISDQQVGIVKMGVVNASGGCTLSACTSTAQVTASQAALWCTGSNKDNTVFWDFKLHT